MCHLLSFICVYVTEIITVNIRNMLINPSPTSLPYPYSPSNGRSVSISSVFSRFVCKCYIQYVLFLYDLFHTAKLFLRFIIVMYVYQKSIPFHCWLVCYYARITTICLSILLLNIWVDSSFWYYKPSCCEILCESLYVHIYFFSDKYLEVERPDCILGLSF